MSDNLKTPRQLKTEQLKQTIVEATTAIIHEHGMEYVTVNNICKAAGISVGCFYHHFSNKEQLLCHCMDKAFYQRRSQFEAIEGEDVVVNVLDFLRLYHTFLMEQGLEFVKSFYVHTNKGLYSYMSYLRGIRLDSPLSQALHRILTKAQEEGLLAEDCSIERLIYELNLLEKGAIFDWCQCDGIYDLAEQFSIAAQKYLRSAVSDAYLSRFGWRPSPQPKKP